MKNAAMIKGTKSGIILVLNPETDWESLKKAVAEKFQVSSHFLGDAAKAISFRGRELTDDEQEEILETIQQNCSLRIICILDEDPETEAAFARALQAKEEEEGKDDVPGRLDDRSGAGFFFKGNLRSGQVLDVETSIIILGDVNAGAKIISKGNVVVLGALKGNVFAGSAGNEDAFVVALDMKPVQVRIADTIARSPDGSSERAKGREAKIAFWEDGNIYIEPLDKNVLGGIRLP